MATGIFFDFVAMPSVPKTRAFLPRTPLFPGMSRTTFYAYSVVARGGVLRIDCLPIFNKPLPILPKNRGTMIRDVQIETTTNPMLYRYFGNAQGAKENPEHGLSGEPHISTAKGSCVLPVRITTLGQPPASRVLSRDHVVQKW